MTRPLTLYEQNILISKAINWSYCFKIENGLIALGNGFEEDDATAYLPYNLLMDKDIKCIEKEHVILAKDITNYLLIN